MKDNSVNGLAGVTMDKIKQMVDVNTVVGSPITTPDGVTIIPISNVSYGFASGGSDLPKKLGDDLFGGGSGAGISINPIGFLVVSGGDVKLLQMSMEASKENAIINAVPDVIDKISDIISDAKSD